MKKYLLTLVMTLTTIGVGAQTFTDGDFTYNVTDADALTVTLTKVATAFTGDLYVPSSVENDDVTYNVTRIASNACSNCLGITGITIPASLLSVGEKAFSGCSGVTSITIESSDVALSVEANTSFRTGSQYSLFIGRDIAYSSGGMSTPFSNVTSLECGGQMTFVNNNICTVSQSTMQSVIIGVNGGNSIRIGDGSGGTGPFWGNSKLASITIGENVASIAASAFRNCGTDSSVEELTLSIANGVQTIGGYAFNGCTKLKNVTIPASVTQIARSAFTGMSGDVTFTVEDSATPLILNAPDGNQNNTLFASASSVTAYMGRNIIRTGYSETGAVFNTKLTTLAFGPDVTAIGYREYYYCSGITGAVTGLTNVVSIGEEAFYSYYTNSITSIEIGDKLETLGVSAFNNCQKLESISLPGTLKVVSKDAFKNCYALSTVTLGEGIEEIGNGAFYYATALEEITIPSTVTKIGRAPFHGSTSQQLKRIIFADSDVTLYYANDNTGYNNGNNYLTGNITLDYFYLGRNVTRDKTGTQLIFGAKEIELGPKVTSISDPDGTSNGLLTGINNSTTSVKVHQLTPFAILDKDFSNNTYSNATLLVPGGTKELYQAADGWKKFAKVETWSYVVNATAVGHGTIALDDEVAANGETATIRKPNGDVLNNSSFNVTMTAEAGYELTSLTQEDLTEPTDPALQEIFVGNDGFTNPFTIETALNHDLSYVATFAPITYNITYDLDGGTLATVNPATYTIESEAITLNNPTKTGYTFAGWTGPDLSEATKSVTIAKGSMGARAYTATWKINQYTITFDSNGGSAVTAIKQDYNSAVTAPAAPTRTGYTFAGWTPALPATIPAENITVTAQWTINQYTITFDSDGGSAVDPITQDYNSAVTAPTAPTREGYTFAGWTPALPATMPAENKTVKATWTPVTYTISYTLDGGTVATANPTSYTIESADITLNNPTKDGYRFVGWTGTDLDAPTKTVTITTGSTGNRSYTATWMENAYLVSIIGEGVTADNMTPKLGQSVVITIEENEDRELTSLTVNGVDVTNEVVGGKYTITNVTADITVVATFKATKEFIQMAHNQATFSCSQALDFSGVDGLKAYIASGYDDGIVLLTRVEKVPANTGLLILGSEGQTYKIPYASVKAVYSNFLKPVLTAQTVAQTEGAYTNYLYGEKDGIVGFYKSSGSGTVAAQKAYLQLPTAAVAGVKGVSYEFDDTLATPVSAVKADAVAPEGVYDIHGRKIPAGQQLRTGIYIVNGRKVVVK